MMTPTVAFLGLWLVLAIYSILMAMDLGAGFLYVYGRWTGHPGLVRVVDTYATPVWEAINALLILFIIGLEAFFPKSINLYALVLLLPVGISFGLLSVRQVAFALRHEKVPFGPGFNPFLFGVLGPLVPLPAMAFFATLMGRGIALVGGTPRFSLLGLMTDPVTVAFMVEALVSEIFLSACLIHWYSTLMKAPDAAQITRRIALKTGVLVLVVSPVVLLITVRLTGSPVLVAELPWFVGSLVVLLASLTFMVRNVHPLWALLTAGLMYLGGFMGYGLAQIPWLIHGLVTLQQAYTNTRMANVIGWVLFLGIILVVIPSGALLTRFLVREARARTP